MDKVRWFSMLIIGSHVSFGGEQLLGSAKEAVSYGANTFMFYTGAPQNTKRTNIREDLLLEAKNYMAQNGIDLSHVICHAPYIINLANNSDLEKWQFSIQFLKNELSRCDALGISYLVLHPGSAVGLPKDVALQNIVDALNLVLSSQFKCQILLETMAGKGTECGSNLEEMAFLTEKLPLVGVCLDTCHLNDSGVDMQYFSEYLEEFDQKIGIHRIHCVHINDSKNGLSSHKDRHANIGFGTIGFDNLLNVIYNEKLKDVPKILETPYVGKSFDDKEKLYPPYRVEIDMIRKKKRDENFLETIQNIYNK